MPKPIRILIDVYNLLFTCGLQERQGDSRRLLRARQRLIWEIRQNVRSEELLAMICVVWDAKEGWGDDEASEPGGPQVRFATDFPDADSMIEKMIEESNAPRQLTVVSSDHRIRRSAERRRCLSVDSETWYDALLDGKVQGNDGETAPSSEKMDLPLPLLDADEIECWKKEVEGLEASNPAKEPPGGSGQGIESPGISDPVDSSPSTTSADIDPGDKDDIELDEIDFGLADFEFDLDELETNELDDDDPLGLLG